MAYGVKLRAPQERRFMFLAAKGATTWLRVRTLRFELKRAPVATPKPSSATTPSSRNGTGRW